MSKSPAFQFYPGDWLQDTRGLSLSARGAWIDLLCFMWNSEPRGTIKRTNEQLVRMLGISQKQFSLILEELTSNNICDYGVNQELGIIVISSRRMIRDEQRRSDWRDRQSKHRDKDEYVTQDVTDLSRDGHANVTSMSPGSSKDFRSSKDFSEKEKIQKENKKEKVSPKGSPGANAPLIAEVLDRLNSKSGKRFNPKSKETIRVLNARIEEGRTREDFFSVVDHQVKEWIDDPKMRKYIRPETLFGPKFEGYLNEAHLPEIRADTSSSGVDSWLANREKERVKS